MRKQRFEDTFFSLLSNFGEILKSVEIGSIENPHLDNNKNKIFGRRVFKKFRNRILQEGKGKISLLRSISKRYLLFFEKYEEHLNPYFKILNQLLQFIHNSSDVQNKQLYINILKAQLSNYELLFILYYATQHESEDFKNLIETYKICDDIPQMLLLHKIPEV